MARHTGPDAAQIPTLEVKATTSPANGAPFIVADMRNVSVFFDGGGGGVTGTVQLQGSIGGVEYVDVGTAVSTWPAVRELTGYFTHLRCKTTVNISAGTPVVRIGGFRD